jgi:uncharacterized membrane protein YphA (DoxX/SURF4 family)
MLRGAAGIAGMYEGYRHLSDSAHPSAEMLAGAASCLSGLLLLIGLFTSPAGVVAGLSALACSMNWLPGISPLEPVLTGIFLAVTCLSLAMLGPGEWSIDARLFGRREIIIPPSPPLE